MARDRPPPPSANGASASSNMRVSAQLSCKYFRPGGIVRGVVQLATDRLEPDLSTEISCVVAQIHAHVSVDSNVLTVPVVVATTPSAPTATEGSSRGLSSTEIQRFAGDSGACLYASAPCVVFSDINIAPTPSETQSKDDTLRRCRRDFALALPENLCPTFRGVSARVFYILSITVHRSHGPGATAASSYSSSLHLPLDVYASSYSFAPPEAPLATGTNGATQQQQQQRATKDRSGSQVFTPVGVRKGSEIPFELRPSLMHGRIETELLQRAQTSIFTIGKGDNEGENSSHLVKLVLLKQFYAPGDVLLGVFDFSQNVNSGNLGQNPGNLKCLEISATLCQQEVLSQMALQPNKIVQTKKIHVFHEFTNSVNQTNLRFSIPHDALPSIQTDLVCFRWWIQFEFTASGGSSNTSSTTGAAAESTTTTTTQPQVFRWQVPIDVRPATPRAPSSFANVPHKLFTGSFRALLLP